MTGILSRAGTEITGRDAIQNTVTAITHRGATHVNTISLPSNRVVARKILRDFERSSFGCVRQSCRNEECCA